MTVAKRIIPCLDVKNNKVIKGVGFKSHQEVGEILALAKRYCDEGADELVFYDITASCDARNVDIKWINDVAYYLNIPFCVAGGISSVTVAEKILHAGADKISLNSPALMNPVLIDQLVYEFGQQCVVIGIDSLEVDGEYRVCKFTGDSKKMQVTPYHTREWIKQVQDRGAGEIVLNCMNQDGKRSGYDVKQLAAMREVSSVPLVASGGAGNREDFLNVFVQAQVDAALAASVFHYDIIKIKALKEFLQNNKIEVRPC